MKDHSSHKVANFLESARAAEPELGADTRAKLRARVVGTVFGAAGIAASGGAGTAQAAAKIAAGAAAGGGSVATASVAAATAWKGAVVAVALATGVAGTAGLTAQQSAAPTRAAVTPAVQRAAAAAAPPESTANASAHAAAPTAELVLAPTDDAPHAVPAEPATARVAVEREAANPGARSVPNAQRAGAIPNQERASAPPATAVETNATPAAPVMASPPAAPVAPVRDPAFEREVRALDRARAALAAGDPARALAESAPIGPSPFAEERAALHIVALCSGGRIAEGTAELAQFATRFPRSLQMQRAERACAKNPKN